MDYTVLGVNSGLGVSLYPFKSNLIGNIESRGIFHTVKNEQWKANYGDIPIRKDEVYFLLAKPDVIISSPDCGSGSVFRLSRAKQFGDNSKNKSLGEFFVAIRRFEPKFFYFENLENLYKTFPKERLVHLLSNYRLVEHTVSVSKFGNSQVSRKRLIIIGIRRDLPTKIDKHFKLPDYTHLIKCCGDLYGDLGREENLEIGHVREKITDTISIHARRRMSLELIRSHWQGRLKGRSRWETEPGFKFSTAPGVYRNLKHKYPSTARKANRQFDQRGLTLTPRQLARIQGVPDEFKIYINPDKLNYWINKARTCITKTPPMEISYWFKTKLEKALKKLS